MSAVWAAAAALLLLGPIEAGELWVVAALAGLQLAYAVLGGFDPSRAALGIRVLRALRRGEIVLHYQPKLSLADGDLLGVEALARWEHRQRGLLPPAEWLTGAELPWTEWRFTRHVLDSALAQARRWREEDGLDIVVCVNVSPRVFSSPRFPRELEAALRRAGVRAPEVQIELTEVRLDLDDEAFDVADALNAMGVGLALDDFGVGHSSMDRLSKLPISELKIDRRFVMRQTTSPRDAAIVRGAIDLGQALGLSVTAEGVETLDDVVILHRHSCDTAQGFFFSPALPPQDLAGWESARHRVPVATFERRKLSRRREDARVELRTP